MGSPSYDRCSKPGKRHSWQPLEGGYGWVKCTKCGDEVLASQAKRGTWPCKPKNSHTGSAQATYKVR